MTALAAIKMSSKGQIVIPKSIRTRLGLKEGDTLIVASQDDLLILKKLTLEDLLKESKRNWRKGKVLSHEETFQGLT